MALTGKTKGASEADQERMKNFILCMMGLATQ
jgi:hypothetical protein